MLLDALCRYFRLQASGLEHLPHRGPAIIVANHSGWMGLDALLLAHVIRRRTGRNCRIMAHRAYFDWVRGIRRIALSRGLRRPRCDEALRTLAHGHLLIVFPEGEAGNFKSSLKRYRLQPFHKGFVRIARRSGAPVIPCAIAGAEESQLNLGSALLGVGRRRLRVPIPVPLPPLPSRWRIRFFPPIGAKELVCVGGTDQAQAEGVAAAIRLELQNRLLKLRS